MTTIPRDAAWGYAEVLVSGGHTTREGVRRELPRLLGPDWPAFAAKHGLAVGEFGPPPAVASVAAMSVEMRQAYIRGADVVAAQPVPVSAPISPASAQGPGTELKALLAELGLSTQTGCGCADHARHMDGWGVGGCRARREEIAAWLEQSAMRVGWWGKLAAATKAVASGTAFRLDVADPYGSLVDLAIARAEAKGL